MQPSTEHPEAAEDAASIALRISSRRRDLAAICFQRALSELVEVAISEQIRLSPAPLERWLESGPSFDLVVVRRFLLEPVGLHLRARFLHLELRPIGRLERTLVDSGLPARIEVRMASQKLASARAGRRRKVGRIELREPFPRMLSPDDPALCLLLRMLEGRSRIHRWRS